MGRITRRSFVAAAASSAALTSLTTIGEASAADSPEGQVFQAAARRYGVPLSLLVAFDSAQSKRSRGGMAPEVGTSHGPMGLVDGRAVATMRALEGRGDIGSLDTLGEAAAASGLSSARVATRQHDNIFAGAALLADVQRRCHQPTGESTPLGSWYQAVAFSSGQSRNETQLRFADDVYAALMSSSATKRIASLRATPAQVGTLEGRVDLLERSHRSRARHHNDSPVDDSLVDAPRGLDVEWLPAAYEKYGPEANKYGNHDTADRPNSPRLTRIVIHDTEETYDNTVKLVKMPTYLAWNYTLRSSDGHVAQHLATKDIGWHAGNWYYNMHSIGLEHEGKALEGTKWYTDSMYRSSVALVRHLCRKYKIPMTRGRIIGHDEVPGIDGSYIKGMHWDPGPYWDWAKYFTLLGCPLTRGTTDEQPGEGDVVRILPDFATNTQVFNGVPVTGVNFVTAHQGPSDDSPLAVDIGLATGPSTTKSADIGARLGTGCDYVVAATGGDDGAWVGVWYLGAVVWFHNPESRPVARVLEKAQTVQITGDTATYGRAYPESAAYPDPSWVQPDATLPYVLKAGQRYVVADAEPPTDYYRAKSFDTPPPTDHVDIVGKERYVGIFLGHRQGFVKAAAVKM